VLEHHSADGEGSRHQRGGAGPSDPSFGEGKADGKVDQPHRRVTDGAESQTRCFCSTGGWAFRRSLDSADPAHSRGCATHSRPIPVHTHPSRQPAIPHSSAPCPRASNISQQRSSSPRPSDSASQVRLSRRLSGVEHAVSDILGAIDGLRSLVKPSVAANLAPRTPLDSPFTDDNHSMDAPQSDLQIESVSRERLLP